MSDLTPQQERFAQLVAEGIVYSEAYKEAYPKSVEWKGNAVYVESSKMMSNPNISLRVRELQEATTKRNQVTLDEVLNEMANWLRFNTKSIFNEDGTMKSLHEMTDEESSSIASYEVVELFDTIDKEKTHIGYLKKVRLLDKRAVAEMFLKKFGAYITTLKLDVEDLSHIADLLDGIKK
jgi:phage terminase small subunit